MERECDGARVQCDSAMVQCTTHPRRGIPAPNPADAAHAGGAGRRDKHGYAILKEIARRTDGAVRLSAGTLYALIRRAEADGLIVETDERPDIPLDDERRRYYRLTALGRKVAAAEIDRLEAIVEMAREKKLVPRPRSV